MTTCTKTKPRLKSIRAIFLGSVILFFSSSGLALAEDCKETAKQIRGDYEVIQADGGIWRFMEKSTRLRADSMWGLQIDGILQRGVTHIESVCEAGKPAPASLIKELSDLLGQARSLNNKSTSRTPAKKLKQIIESLLKESRSWAEKNKI
ncbi:MAG: hypothetical protein G3M70_12355 [Candidatus Nitronauta litoralis]|uniref:Uncharacterized protein n=1 Tax=Candidatus Nitronauta litoralis TaxID=2705533 RepID=A0A7T0BX95_9BACT|nr:MAG: hypothetical protein G3M70_12355 [Candidatus Nitronauta litoralis]